MAMSPDTTLDSLHFPNAVVSDLQIKPGRRSAARCDLWARRIRIRGSNLTGDLGVNPENNLD